MFAYDLIYLMRYPSVGSLEILAKTRIDAATGCLNVPTAAQVAAIIKQKFTWPTTGVGAITDVSQWAGEIKSSFETGYGISLGIFDTTTKTWNLMNPSDSTDTTRASVTSTGFKPNLHMCLKSC